jgi:EAL domain-containing protein (putative c-di-GMP-specific phosphodiesterase class I)
MSPPSQEAARAGQDLERRLAEDRERFLTFAFAGNDMLLEADPEGRVTFAAGAFRTRLGREPDSLLGQTAAQMVAPEDRSTFGTCLGLLAARGRIAATALRLSNAEHTPYVVSGMARRGPGGATRLCLSFGPPPGPLPQAGLAVLTGTKLSREAEDHLRAAELDPDGAAPVLDFLELSGAHAALPAAEVTALILGQTGVGGMAGEIAPGRFGLLRGSDTAEGPALDEIVARLQDALGTEVQVAGAGSVSLGVRSDEVSMLQAVRALRIAMSAFARGGAPGLSGFGKGLNGFVTAASLRTNAMRKAIAERRFSMSFQPIVSLNDRLVHHYEALIRPDGLPDLQDASPGDFVALAEMLGLAEELDWAVFEEVRRAAARGGGHLAFNLSGLSVQSPAFRERLLAAISRATSSPAPGLLAEVTETAEIEDEGEAAATIEGLRERGVPVCIDDFGAGAAAFRYLRRFKLDHVKIDGSYVRQAVESDRDRGFVAAMVDLSLTVGATAIAEQIENEAVAEIMRSLGVRFGQGWLFGRPGELPGPATAVSRRRGNKDSWE